MDDTRPPVLHGFGRVAAVGPDGPVDLGGPKQRAVLALLMLDPGAVVTLDRIVDRMWGLVRPSYDRVVAAALGPVAVPV